jgi:hypothetical protein
MKTTELIEKLQEILKEHGDIGIYVNTYEEILDISGPIVKNDEGDVSETWAEIIAL